MGSMMDDINKFAKIWDQALDSGIFKDEAPKTSEDSAEKGADFFGNYRADDYDIDRPLNESDLKHWNDVLKIAGNTVTKKDLDNNQKVSNSMGKASNPIYPYSVGMDQEIEKWDTFRQKLEELDELKKNLHNLESNLNKIMSEAPVDSKPEGAKKAKKKKSEDEMDKIAKDINDAIKKVTDLSNELTGKFGQPN
jgi:DNA repair ATPase RecN